jgi:DNA-binding response OmpR family regulator
MGREFLRAALEASGYEVIEAENGEAALEKAEECSPDLMLLDIHMPLRDGLSVWRNCEHGRNSPPLR